MDEEQVTRSPEQGEEEHGAAIRSHLAGLMEQEAALRGEVPDFSLAEELRDERFLRLTSPLGGVSVRDAYYALHVGELTEQARARLAEAVSSAARRPREGCGTTGTALHEDPKTMSRERRAALKARIYAAAGKGEKVYPD